MEADGARARVGREWCKAAFWIDFRGRRYPVLPREVAPLLLVPIALLFIVLGVLEWRLGLLAARGEIVGSAWQKEDRVINELNTIKIKQRGAERRWISEGIPWPRPDHSRKRLIVVGDSFVWGSGNLNANDIWWRQLAKELQRRGYWSVDVMALGLSGASTQDQLQWLRDEGWLERTRPDLLIFGYVTNDPAIREGAGFAIPQVGADILPPNWSGLDRTLGAIAPNATEQMKNLLTRKWGSKVTGAYTYEEWELKLLQEPNISRYGKVLDDLGAFLRQRAVPHVFFTLPNSPTPDVFAPRYNGVRQYFESASIPFVDLLPSFIEKFGEDRPRLGWGVNPANGHPGPTTTGFYACRVADWLELNYPHLLGERSEPPSNLEPRINDWMPPNAEVRQIAKKSWALGIPNERVYAQRLPIGRPFTMLAFEHPVAIDTILIQGGDLDEVELFYTTVAAPTGLERSDPVSAGKQSGPSAHWQLPANALIDTLTLSGNAPRFARDAFAPAELTMTFREPAVRP